MEERKGADFEIIDFETREVQKFVRCGPITPDHEILLTRKEVTPRVESPTSLYIPLLVLDNIRREWKNDMAFRRGVLITSIAVGALAGLCSYLPPVP